MPIQLSEENGGKREEADYQHYVPAFERLARQHGMAIVCKPIIKARVR